MRLTGSRERSLGPGSRAADPHLISSPSGRGSCAESMMSMCLARRGTVRHFQFMGIDMGQDSPCISRQPKGNCRPAWNYVCNRDAPRLRGARTIFQIIDQCCSDLPGLETDSVPETGQTVLRP